MHYGAGRCLLSALFRQHYLTLTLHAEFDYSEF